MREQGAGSRKRPGPLFRLPAGSGDAGADGQCGGRGPAAASAAGLRPAERSGGGGSGHHQKEAFNRACKPSPVADGHLSWTPVAKRLQRPYPRGRRAATSLSYSVILRVGFAWPAGHPAAGALLPRRCTLTALADGGLFLWHFPWGRPRWVLPSTLPYGARTFLRGLAAPATIQPG